VSTEGESGASDASTLSPPDAVAARALGATSDAGVPSSWGACGNGSGSLTADVDGGAFTVVNATGEELSGGQTLAVVLTNLPAAEWNAGPRVAFPSTHALLLLVGSPTPTLTLGRYVWDEQSGSGAPDDAGASAYARGDSASLDVDAGSGVVTSGAFIAQLYSSTATCATAVDADALGGAVTLTEVSASSVKGTFTLAFASVGNVSGSFDVPICSVSDAGLLSDLTVEQDAGAPVCQ